MRKATLVMVLLAAVAVVAFPGSAAAQSSDVTFHKDIEPILQRSCQVCHRPDNMAPMSLMNYQETRPWARSIKNRVEIHGGFSGNETNLDHRHRAGDWYSAKGDMGQSAYKRCHFYDF